MKKLLITALILLSITGTVRNTNNIDPNGSNPSGVGGLSSEVIEINDFLNI